MTIISQLANVLFVESANAVLSAVPCDSSVTVGAVVRATAGGIVVLALADSIVNANAIGVVESKETATTCTIRLSGLTGDLFSALDVAQTYYLSDAIPGAITAIAPTASGSVVLKIGQPLSSTALIVQKGAGIVRL